MRERVLDLAEGGGRTVALVLVAALLGAGIAAGQNIILDPNAGTVADFPGSIRADSLTTSSNHYFAYPVDPMSNGGGVYLLANWTSGNQDIIGSYYSERSSGARGGRRVDIVFSTTNDGSSIGSAAVDATVGQYRTCDWKLVKATYNSATYLGLQYTNCGSFLSSTRYFTGFAKQDIGSMFFKNVPEGDSGLTIDSEVNYHSERQIRLGGKFEIADGSLDMSDNYIDNKEGLWASYLTTTQASAEAGTLVNAYENVDISDSTYTKNDANTVTVQRTGVYRISYQVNIHRTGSSSRNVMRSYIRINGGNRVDRSATACYIRTNAEGDECTNAATVMLDLSSGDTVELYTHEERGAETGNDIEYARINMEYLG